MGRAQLPILNSEILYFISGDVVPTGMGGRRVSPVDAGGSGRSRSLRAENTPLSWSAVGGCRGALVSSGGAALGDRGATAATGRDWVATEGTGSGPTAPGPRAGAAPGAG